MHATLPRNTYYALLSGAHSTLPLGELKGILEAHRVEYRIIELHDQLVLFSASVEPVFVTSRAGMVKEVGLALAVSEASREAVLESIKAIGLEDLVTGKSFAVRFERLRGYAKSIIDQRIVLEVGEYILSRCHDCRVDLTKPQVPIRIIVSEGLAVIGLELSKLDVKKLLERRPHLRPFYYPGALDPRLSRVFVNLSRAPPGGTYYDPFCGTGGFAVEALIAGINVVCSDIADVVVEGSIRNLNAYPIKGYYYSVIQADAVRMPIRAESVDAIGTDPPYGRSISTRGRRLLDILEGFLGQAVDVLKKGCYTAFATPHWVDPRDLVEKVGLRLVELYFMKVHGGLTRILAVARKP